MKPAPEDLDTANDTTSRMNLNSRKQEGKPHAQAEISRKRDRAGTNPAVSAVYPGTERDDG
jgi:hypothetical protein